MQVSGTHTVRPLGRVGAVGAGRRGVGSGLARVGADLQEEEVGQSGSICTKGA